MLLYNNISNFHFFFVFQVNGTRVTHCTHVDVVNLIKCKFAFIYFYCFDIKSQTVFFPLHVDEKRKEKPNVFINNYYFIIYSFIRYRRSICPIRPFTSCQGFFLVSCHFTLNARVTIYRRRCVNVWKIIINRHHLLPSWWCSSSSFFSSSLSVVVVSDAI